MSSTLSFLLGHLRLQVMTLQHFATVLQNGTMIATAPLIKGRNPARTPWPTLAFLVITAIFLPTHPWADDRTNPTPVRFPDLGHDHIPNPLFPHKPYNSTPPSSGPHTSYTAEWGQHQTPVAPEIWLHNLEHGGVVIGYDCDCPELVDALIELADDYPLTIIAPNPELPTRVALAAWQHVLTFDTLNEAASAAVADFLATFHGVDHHPPGTHMHIAAPTDQTDKPTDRPTEP